MHSAKRRGYSNTKIHLNVFYEIFVVLIHNAQHQLRGQPTVLTWLLRKGNALKRKRKLEKTHKSSGQSLSSLTRIHILMKSWYPSDHSSSSCIGLCLCVSVGDLGMFVNKRSAHYAFVFFNDGLMERWEGNYPHLARQLAWPLSDWFVVAAKKGLQKINVDFNVPSKKDLNDPPA